MLKRKIAGMILMLCCLQVPLTWGDDFTDNGNSTVTDHRTGLIWQQQDDGITITWEQALSYCEALTFGGSSAWRLPNVKELKFIANMTLDNPAIDLTYFPNTKSLPY
ncbi:DUF1566 domain-containing protein [Deltaproteobacteria bacterium TL4]